MLGVALGPCGAWQVTLRASQAPGRTLFHDPTHSQHSQAQPAEEIVTKQEVWEASLEQQCVNFQIDKNMWASLVGLLFS